VVEVEAAMMNRLGVVAITSLAIAAQTPLFAQVPSPSVLIDTARARLDQVLETTADSMVQVKSPSGIDSVVAYSAADSIVYDLPSRTMFLYGKGDITYKDLGLKAANIDINWNTSILNAQGVPDTSDTTGKKQIGLPDMIDGRDVYKGAKVSYNFKSKRGRIDLAETEMEKGFYHGEALKKVDSDVLFVEDGRYTTCELEHPHYYFGSPAMKITVRDKVVARPVYLYISDVPIFALPFGIFPNERGRRSGLIAPAYGESSRGRYLLHLGYYWAMTDYTDLAVRADGYSKGSYTLYGDFRYALRYNFTGSISGSYARSVNGERGDPDYSDQKLFNVSILHNQEFNPTTRLDVNFTFTSGSYYRQTSFNFNDLLQQTIFSNATLNKSWEGTPNSISLNASRRQDLSTDEVSEVLPSISFNRSQSFPFRSKKAASDPASGGILGLIGYSYSSQFINRREKRLLNSAQPALGFDEDRRRGINHDVAVSASPKIGYFTFSPSFIYTEKWYDKRIVKEFNPSDSSVTTRDVKAFKAVRFFETGVSASTKVYGIVQPGVFGITGLRHQVTPTISYTYQPDFSKLRYGYYGTYLDATGQTVKYSFFEKEVFGGAPGEERQAITFRMGNIFEMKTESGDTSGQENKFQLLNLDVSTSYNFVRDSLKFDEIRLGYRTSIGQWLNIGGGSSFNVYKFETDPANPLRGRRVNKYLWKEEGRLAQLMSFNISLSTRLSGDKQQTTSGPEKTAADSLKEKSGYVGLYDEAPPDFSIPWNLDLSWNFTQNQFDPRVKTRSSNLSVGLGFNLTESWKITANTNYDIINNRFAAPQVTVYRDLHCWEMNFSWVPTGVYSNYRLEIRLKAPQLQDIKLTKQASSRGLY
jgi:lipopolysaccharide assembly outer membrane protein LptD (OstA)